MSTFVKTKHDLGFLDTDGSTTVGLRLARDAKGNPIYRTMDDEYLASQMFTGTPGYGNLPPEKELAIRQDDWRSGFGQEVYDANDPKRYFSSIGMDMRYKGMAVAGPIATGIAVPSTHSLPTDVTIANASFEDWTDDDPNDWTEGESGVGADKITEEASSPVQHGSSSCYFDIGSATGSAWVDQAISSPTEWIGYAMTVTGQGYRHGANCTGALHIYRNGSTAANDAVAGADAWDGLSVSYTVPAGTTSLSIRFIATCDGTSGQEIYCDNISATISYTAPVAKTHPHAFAEFNDLLYLDFGKFLYKLNSTGSGWAQVHSDVQNVYGVFAATVTDMEAFTDNYLYIAIGLSNEYYYMNTSQDFLQSDKGENMQFFRRVDAAAPTMWGNATAYTIDSSTNPLNAGSWAGATTVDSSYHNITDLISKSGALYIMKEDMPYYLNSSGQVQNDLAPELRSGTRSTSGKNSFLWKNKLYIPFGTQGLLETDGTTNTFLNPASYCTNLSDFVGRVMAVAGDEEYLFVAVDKNNAGAVFTGTATSNINCSTIHDSTNDLSISLWFRLDSAFSAASTADQYLFGKYDDSTNYLYAYLSQSDGKLYLAHREGNGAEAISSAETSWTADTWYHVIVSCSTTNGQRMIIDDGTAVTGASNQTAISLTADFVLGNRDDGTSTAGLIGRLRNIVTTQDSLSTAEEASLYAGVSPSDKYNHWELHEASGTTAYDDGSGADNGTLDSAVTWLNKTEILAGREETIAGTTGWIWHPITEVSIGIAETMFVSSVYQKRLWVASTHSTESVYYIPLPTGYGDITNDANRTFQNGSYMITPWLHGNFKSDSKGFIKLALTMGNTSSTVYFTVEYQLKGSTNWTEINSTAKFKTSPTTSGYIPVDDISGANPTSNMIRFRITAVTGDSKDTPILYGYDCRAILYPTNRRIIECEILCDDEITLKDGLVERGQAATIKTALEGARNATWPVTFYPLGWESSSDTIYVKFLPLQSSVTKKEKARGIERHYLLRLQEISLS